MTALGLQDFPAFFRDVHGYDPFPWQARLAKQVLETGKWPSLLDLPTGAGKTAAIDIAVFHLACEAGQGPERRAPLRILFVIDRRIVVDEASRRAGKIAAALIKPKSDVLALERYSRRPGSWCSSGRRSGQRLQSLANEARLRAALF